MVKKSVRIDIIGIDKTQRYIKKKNSEAYRKLDRGIRDATLFIFSEVKSSIAGRRDEPTSVDTGQFLNTIQMQAKGNDAIVFSELSYAPFLEFGTSRMRPRRHFRNTADRHRNKVKQLLNNELKTI